jgi:hypothetical protein
MTSDDERQSEPEANPESGLFSQLPRTRPGVRSPRRRGSAGKQENAGRGQKLDSQPAALRAAEAAAEAEESAAFDPLDRRTAQPEPAQEVPSPPEADFDGPDVDDEPERGRSLGPASLEDLAWAGVAVTAEAATLGVRLLGRAVDAAKRATERS